MTVQAGGLLDQKYRRAQESQGPNDLLGTLLDIDTSGPVGAQIFLENLARVRARPFDQSLNLRGLLTVVAATPVGKQLYLDRFAATMPRPMAGALAALRVLDSPSSGEAVIRPFMTASG